MGGLNPFLDEGNHGAVELCVLHVGGGGYLLIDFLAVPIRVLLLDVEYLPILLHGTGEAFAGAVPVVPLGLVHALSECGGNPVLDGAGNVGGVPAVAFLASQVVDEMGHLMGCSIDCLLFSKPEGEPKGLHAGSKKSYGLAGVHSGVARVAHLQSIIPGDLAEVSIGSIDVVQHLLQLRFLLRGYGGSVLPL